MEGVGRGRDERWASGEPLARRHKMETSTMEDVTEPTAEGEPHTEDGETHAVEETHTVEGGTQLL